MRQARDRRAISVISRVNGRQSRSLADARMCSSRSLTAVLLQISQAIVRVRFPSLAPPSLALTCLISRSDAIFSSTCSVPVRTVLTPRRRQPRRPGRCPPVPKLVKRAGGSRHVSSPTRERGVRPGTPISSHRNRRRSCPSMGIAIWRCLRAEFAEISSGDCHGVASCVRVGHLPIPYPARWRAYCNLASKASWSNAAAGFSGSRGSGRPEWA
jgi:hypothetical protein